MGAKLSGGQPGGKVRKIESNSDINVTPFVDIMLVLLIIFMVSAPLATVSINLDLPPPDPSKIQEDPKEPIFISIQESGELFIEQTPTTVETLHDDLCRRVGNQAGPDCREERIFVRAQPEVKYERFMEIMNTLRTKGWLKVGLLNEDIV